MDNDDFILQELDYPDNNYKGGVGVDEKKPELMWAVPGRSAVPELFNWIGRKTTEDLDRIREYLDKFESIQKLAPMSELTQIAGKEADIVYVGNFQPVYQFVDDRLTEVGGTASVVKTEPEIVLRWSSNNVVDGTDPIITLHVDVTGEGEQVGEETISTTHTLFLPDSAGEVQESTFGIGELSQGDTNQDGWDDVRGQTMNIFVQRDPDSEAIGAWNLHSVEVR